VITSLRIALVVAALACAAWLREGHYAVGIDFEGGAMLTVRPHGDPQTTLVHALRPGATVRTLGDRVVIELESGDDDDARALAATLTPYADIESTQVIHSAWPRWMGRPLAAIVACVAAACWLGLLARPRAWPFALAGTFALAWTVALVDQLARGGTLSLPIHVAGIVLGLAAAPAARPGAGDPVARLRSALPAGIALLAVVIAAVIVARATGPSLVHFAAMLVVHPAIAAASIAALAAVAATRES